MKKVDESSVQGSKMDISNIRSVQRVVNFTPNNGKMLRTEQPQATMPGVTMICDLPLLFMNGLPTCLENLSVNQLEKFVPYMINCSCASTSTKPKWWPNEIVFSAVPQRESDISDMKWLSSLKKLVASCYSYHGCDYALRLCADTSHECHSEWTLMDGLDGTMYLYNKVTRQISTSFKSANIMCSRRTTFSNNACVKSNACHGSVRRNKPPIRIYLCDTCDSEFRTLEKVQVHEKTCSKKCSMPIQDCRAEMHKIRIPNTKTQTPCIKVEADSRIPKLFCLPPQLKKRTASSKTLSSSDNSGSQNIPLHFYKNRRNNFDSLKKYKDLISSLPRSSCQFSLNSSSHSLDSGNNKLRILNISAKCNISHPESPVSKKRMSLMPNKQSQGLSIRNSEADLCDKCDGEFSFSDFRHRETYCKGRTELIPSPVVSVGENDTTQDYFLKYFHLSSLNPCPVSQGTAWFGNPMRYSSIPISSPLGRLIHGRTQVPIAAVSSKMEKVERYCPAKPTEVFKSMRTKQNTDDWSVSWKSLKSTTENSLHTYLYPTQRWWKMPLLHKMQMKEEKKQRLLRTCKSIQVSVRRMTNQEIQNYTSCRSVTVKLKKLSLEKNISHPMKNKTSPMFIKFLSNQQSMECVTENGMSPKIERLSFQEIKKLTKPTQTLSDVTHQITNAGLIGPLSKVSKDKNSSKISGNRIKNRSRKFVNKSCQATSIGKRTYCDQFPVIYHL